MHNDPSVTTTANTNSATLPPGCDQDFGGNDTLPHDSSASDHLEQNEQYDQDGQYDEQQYNDGHYDDPSHLTASAAALAGPSKDDDKLPLDSPDPAQSDQNGQDATNTTKI